MSAPSATTPTLIQSLQRGLNLIEAVATHGPMTAKSLSDSTGIVLPTTHHHLRTLVHEGYLCRAADGRYALGQQFAHVCRLERGARGHRLIRLEMSALAASARASVVVAVLQPNEIVVSHFIAHPCTPPFDCWPGMALPGHATAVGKNILLRMSPDARQGYVASHRLDALTARTVVSLWKLDKEATGDPITRSDQEYQYGLCCVATQLGSVDTLAAVGAAFSATRTPRARADIEARVVAAAGSIARAMQMARM